ncbi:inositol monophosphatase family protein [Roseomonas sp. BN140053]|uniref:inositol monophosphatase family protein n=1 Tax=Roseomonas sp. BN140053 TaxID=3391898 RepID=UPI0039E7C649
MDDLTQALALAETAARCSRDLLRAGGGVAESAIGRDIKLEQDKASEAMILSLLREGSPFPILSEEAGWIGGAPGAGEFWWAVDPLDGSWNFFRGVPLCCVSVALCRDDRAVLGAIYDFNRDELFSGGPGLGLRRDGAPFEPPPRPRAVLATGLPAKSDHSPAGLAKVFGRVESWTKVRMIGSAALSLAWVSCGRFDGYEEEGVLWWDVAAGCALVEAAGGTVSVTGDVLGGPLHVVCTTGKDRA